MKKVVFIIVCIVSIFIINGFVHSIINLWQKQQLIVTAQEELTAKQKENAALVKKLGTVKTDAFVEEQARNELLLGKTGESVVIVPQSLLSPTPMPVPKTPKPVSHWNAWLQLLINPSS